MTIKIRYLWEFSLVLIVYTFSFWIIDFFIMPMQLKYFAFVSEHICLLFLPHAIRLLTIWLYGFKGLIYMLIVTQFSYYLIYDNHPTAYLHFIGPFVAPVTAYCLLELFKRYWLNPYEIKNWKTLISVGILVSFIHGYLLALIYGFPNDTFLNTLYYAIGDLNGLLLALLFLFGYFRIERLFSKSLPDR